MFDGNWRQTVEKGVDPIGEGLRKLGVSADVLTCVGIAMSVATAFVIGNGYLRWGFVAMLATGIPDLLDGAVAKASGSASKRGAFFDSSIDRFSDAFVFVYDPNRRIQCFYFTFIPADGNNVAIRCNRNRQYTTPSFVLLHHFPRRSIKDCKFSVNSTDGEVFPIT